MCAGSLCGLILIPVWIHEWLNDARGLTGFRLIVFGVMLLGSAGCASFGIAGIRFGVRYLRADSGRDA